MASKFSSFYRKSGLGTLTPLSNAPMIYRLRTKPTTQRWQGMRGGIQVNRTLSVRRSVFTIFKGAFSKIGRFWNLLRERPHVRFQRAPFNDAKCKRSDIFALHFHYFYSYRTRSGFIAFKTKPTIQRWQEIRGANQVPSSKRNIGVYVLFFISLCRRKPSTCIKRELLAPTFHFLTILPPLKNQTQYSTPKGN